MERQFYLFGSSICAAPPQRNDGGLFRRPLAPVVFAGAFSWGNS